MKLHSNPYKLFFLAVMFATIAIGAFVGGIEGYKWTHAYKPFAQFFVGVISICLGPSLIATALNARASEDPLTVWKKTWPATFAGGILAPLGGLAMLWKLFVN
jgi:hypothetical protein